MRDPDPVAKIPDSTKTSLHQRLSARTHDHWPELTGISVRHRAGFAYVTGHLPDGENLPLCRLRSTGSAHVWGFAIHGASYDDYQGSVLPGVAFSGSAADALDCACGLYLGQPQAWTDTPTN